MEASKLHVKVESDMSEVQEDLSKLTKHLEELSSTVERLNENGINIKLKISLDTNKFKKFFRFFV